MTDKKRVLIVSDDPQRLNSIVQKVRGEGMVPIHYLNIMAARLAAQKDNFFLVIIDLTLPLEPKLGLIRIYAGRDDHSPIVVIGKGEYLATSGALDGVEGIKRFEGLEDFITVNLISLLK